MCPFWDSKDKGWKGLVKGEMGCTAEGIPKPAYQILPWFAPPQAGPHGPLAAIVQL